MTPVSVSLKNSAHIYKPGLRKQNVRVKEHDSKRGMRKILPAGCSISPVALAFYLVDTGSKIVYTSVGSRWILRVK